MPRTALSLQESEAVVVRTAGAIFAAFVQSGQLDRESESEVIARSVQIAIKIAKLTDDKVRSDQEVL